MSETKLAIIDHFRENVIPVNMALSCKISWQIFVDLTMLVLRASLSVQVEVSDCCIKTDVSPKKIDLNTTKI